MAAFPIGKNDDSRTRSTNHARDLQSIYPAVLDATVRNIECFAPASLHELCGLVGFALTIGGGPASSHFAPGQVEYSRALTLLRHLQQRSTAGLFYIVTVSSDSKYVEL